MVTGRYAWSLGSHHMRSTLVESPVTFTEHLRSAGYYVNWENKTDFNFEPRPAFADEKSAWLDRLRSNSLPKQPFFLYRNLDVTHESTMWCDVALKPANLRERIEAHPLYRGEPLADAARLRVPDYLPDTPAVRANLARFYDALRLADLQIGEVLAAVDASPHARNTLVIYLCDHGRGLAREKRWCYGAGVHLSLVMRWPAGIRAGSVSTDLVSWVDLAPTLLSLAGVPIPKSFQGQVFLGPDAAPPRSWVAFGRDRMDEAFDRVRGVADGRYHYLRNFFPQLPYCQRNQYMEKMETTQELRELNAQGRLTAAQALWMSPAKPAEELYDTQTDPQMTHNLAGSAEHQPIRDRLRATLDRVLAETNDLGSLTERELIARGMVTNRLDSEYASRIAPLPERYRVGVEQTVLEMPPSPVTPLDR